MSRSSYVCSISFFAGIGILAPSAFAHAAPEASIRSATDGVDRVYHDLSSQGDASSIELNPGLLPSSRGLDVTLLGYIPIDTYSRGRGFGGFVAWGSRFGIATGLGFQLVLPHFRDEAFDAQANINPSVTKVSWALAGGDPRFATVGFGLHGIRTDGRWLQRPDIDIGLVARVTNYGSLGANLRLSPIDLDDHDGRPGALRLASELSVRPFGTELVELAGGLNYTILTDDGGPRQTGGLAEVLGRGRLSVRYHGLALRGEVEQVRIQQLDATTRLPLRQTKAVRGSVSLEATWDFASISGGLHAGGLGDGVDGWGIQARFHTRRRDRVFWPRMIAAERLATDQLNDERELIDVLIRLERAEAAGRRTIVLVDARDTTGGWASLHEVRQALIRIRRAGGHVFAYVENTSLADYYLASAAGHVYMHPSGSLETYQLGRLALFFKGALDRLGIEAEVIRSGPFKSAYERWTHTDPSVAHQDQEQQILRTHRSFVAREVGHTRQRSPADVLELLATAPLSPEEAFDRGWVDDVIHRDELLEHLSTELQASVQLAELHDTRSQDRTWSTAPYIAIIVVDGTLHEGHTQTIPLLGLSMTGAESIAEAIREARADPACRGLIIRIDSPGGSLVASDIIRREIERTQHAFDRQPRRSPPIVVSMGDTAASGGYFIALGAQHILADPLTVTGSIGVISLNWNADRLLKRFGIHAQQLGQGDNVAVHSPFRGYSPTQRDRLQALLDHADARFRRIVGEQRSLSIEQVDALAFGRLFPATRAFEAGLVDALGGLHEALLEIRHLSHTSPLRHLDIRVQPIASTWIDLVLDHTGDPFFGRGPARTAHRRATESAASTNPWSTMLDPIRSVLPWLSQPRTQPLLLTPP